MAIWGLCSIARHWMHARFRSPDRMRQSPLTTAWTEWLRSAAPCRFPVSDRKCALRDRKLSMDPRSQCDHELESDAGGSGTRGGFFPVAQFPRTTGADIRPGYGNALRRKRHSRKPHQPAGACAARFLPAAEFRDAAGTTTRFPSWTFCTRTVSRRVSIRPRIEQPDIRHLCVSKHAQLRPNFFGFLDTDQHLRHEHSLNWVTGSDAHVPDPGTQFSRSSARTTSFFADRRNVSGEAGITGNNQEPVNWGPPQPLLLERHRGAFRRAAVVHSQPDQRRFSAIDFLESRPA